MICRIKPDEPHRHLVKMTPAPELGSGWYTGEVAAQLDVGWHQFIPIVTPEELSDDSDDELDWKMREAWWIERCNNAWLEGMIYGLFGGAAMVTAMLLAGWIGWRWL